MLLRKLCSASAALLLCAGNLAAEKKKTFSADSTDLADLLDWADEAVEKKIIVEENVNWSGAYKGGPGKTTFVLKSGAIASGKTWTFATEGYGEIMGAGRISAKINLGYKDDTIGSFAYDAKDERDNSLRLGYVALGDGTNRVKAYNADMIDGGAGNDTVILTNSDNVVVNLKNGTNRFEAVDIKTFTGGIHDDTVILTGDAGGTIQLFDGANILEARSVKNVRGGDNEDTVTLNGNAGHVNLGGGENILSAVDIAGYTGGSGSDTLKLSGEVSGDINLGGGKFANTVSIGGEINGDVESTAAGQSNIWDKVSIGGGQGDIELGNGSNELTVLGNWEGDYTGGTGSDIIKVKSGSAISIDDEWDLGAGDNVIRGSGAISLNEIILGDGDDTIGNFSNNAGDSDNELVISSSINLGGGINKVWVTRATDITSGSGADTVILRPKKELTPKINLGSGSNKLFIAGRPGVSDNRQVVLEMSGTANSQADSLTLCNNKVTPALSCEATSLGFNASFNVLLDAAAGNIWEEINIQNQESENQSLLAINGDNVSLKTSRLNNLKIVTNGAVGREMSVTGKMAANPLTYKFSGKNLIVSGTLFELDFSPSKAISDVLNFGAGSANIGDAGSNFGISIGLALTDKNNASGNASAEFLSIHTDSALSGSRDPKNASIVKDPFANIDVLGAFGDRIFLNGQEWLLESTISQGVSSYSLKYISDIEVLGISGSADTAWKSKLKDGSRIVKISNDWTVDYVDGPLSDVIVINSEAEISGTKLTLDKGHNAIRGSGKISDTVEVEFGDGQDTIGNFLPGAPLSDNELVLNGHVNLGGGKNKVMAKRISKLTGGSGPDMIIVSGDATGVIDLGGESTNNTLIVGGTIDGDLISAATGTDIVSVGGGTGNVNLGNGLNHFTVASGTWSGNYEEGLGNDIITVNSGAAISSESLTLEKGSNAIKGSGKISSDIYMSDGNDVIGNFSASAPASDNLLALTGTIIDLGDGENQVKAAKIDGYLFGSFDGNDTVIAHGSTSYVLLYDGQNRLEASSVDFYYGGEEQDSVFLTGYGDSIELGNGSNRLEAGKVGYVYGGSGVDTVTVTGTGTYVDLGDGSNRLEISSADTILGGKDDDTIILGRGIGKDYVALGNGQNTLTITQGVWSGTYHGGAGKDTITINSGAELSARLFLRGGENLIKGSGKVSTHLVFGGEDNTIGNFAPGAPSSDNGLDLIGRVALGNGTNRLRAASATSITGGTGEDKIILTPKSSFSLSTLDLGGGRNSLWIVGDQEAVADLVSRKATISLSGGLGENDDMNFLYLCNEAVKYAGGCGALPGTGYAFNVALDASGGNAWGTINIENEASEAQSVLTVSGDVELQNPKFKNFRLGGNGVAGDKITVTGSYEILKFSRESSQNTIFELDVNALGKISQGENTRSDEIVFDSTSRAVAGKSFAKVVTIDVRPVPSSVNSVPSEGDRINVVTVKNKSDIEGVTLINRQVSLNGHAWRLGSSVLVNKDKIYFLEPAPVPSSIAAQQKSAASKQLASLVSIGVANGVNSFKNQIGGGSQMGMGVLQNRESLAPWNLWTRFSAGTKTEAKGTVDEHSQSVRFFTSGTDLFAHKSASMLSRHSLIIGHGTAKSSKSSLNSTITTFGYGGIFDYANGQSFRVYLSSGKISSQGIPLRSGLDFRGFTALAEAGWESVLSGELILEYGVGIEHSAFQNKAETYRGDLSSFESLSGNLGIGFDYAPGLVNFSHTAEPQRKSVYGKFSVSEDFQADFTFIGSTGNISTERRETWVNADLGLSWDFGNASLLVEISRAKRFKSTLEAQKSSFAFGYEMRW